MVKISKKFTKFHLKFNIFAVFSLLDHLRECKAKHAANCVVCKELIALICRHARFCYNQHCRIPYCTVMKDNMDYSEDSDVESVNDTNIKKVNNIQLILFVF